MVVGRSEALIPHCLPVTLHALTARAKLLTAHVEGAVGAVAHEHRLAACADEDLAGGEEG